MLHRLHIILLSAFMAMLPLGGADRAHAADFTARQVTVAIHKAAAGEKIDFSGKDLSGLDLAGIDFKGAQLAKTNLYGADLSSANLKATNLAGAKLDRAVLTKADFSGANLEGATILKPSVFSSPDFDIAETPNFTGAILRGARIAARMDGVKFREADLSGAQIGPFDMSVEGGLAPSSLMQGADFSAANLSQTDIRNIDFTFGRFPGARLNGAKLTALDLTNADFSGADLTGAQFSGCKFDGATFTGAKGLDSAKGLETVSNLNRPDR
jgi:uncharacterized protein YjbI with pentapeptide repeats